MKQIYVVSPLPASVLFLGQTLVTCTVKSFKKKQTKKKYSPELYAAVSRHSYCEVPEWVVREEVGWGRWIWQCTLWAFSAALGPHGSPPPDLLSSCLSAAFWWGPPLFASPEGTHKNLVSDAKPSWDKLDGKSNCDLQGIAHTLTSCYAFTKDQRH